jgi:predicted secreted Zn-dependent protease
MKSSGRIAKRVAGCLLATLCSGACAEVITGDTVERYSIRGASDADLRREMNAKGPLGAGGRRFDGHTRWNINWRYTYREDGGTCRINSVTTDLKVVMTMPEWSDERAAPVRLQARWREYVAALTVHENGHRANGIDAAREIDRGISALPAQANCNAMSNAANVLGSQIIRKYNEHDLDYDRSTDHGRTQGARFP